MNEQIRNIAIALIAGIVIIGGVWISRTSSPSSDASQKTPSKWSAGALEARESFFDFSTISMAAGKVSHEFTVKNTSPQLVTITKISTSCMCTVALLKREGAQLGPFGMPGHGVIPSISETLLPGETVRVVATFDPAAHGPSGTGKIRRIVTVETNSQTKPKIELSFAADVTP